MEEKPEFNREEAEKNIEDTLAKANDESLTDDQRQEMMYKALNDYSAALRQEFEVQVADNPSNAPEFTSQFFREHLGVAAAGIVHLAANSSSDSVRRQACNDIITYALADAEAEGDPIKQLMVRLSQNKQPAPEGNENAGKQLPKE